jgi:hypothetical protein
VGDAYDRMQFDPAAAYSKLQPATQKLASAILRQVDAPGEGVEIIQVPKDKSYDRNDVLEATQTVIRALNGQGTSLKFDIHDHPEHHAIAIRSA